MKYTLEFTYYDEKGAVVGRYVTDKYKTFNGFMKYGAHKFKNAACGWSSNKAVKVGYKPFSYSDCEDIAQAYLSESEAV